MSAEPKTRVKEDYCGGKNVLIFWKLEHIFCGDEEQGGKNNSNYWEGVAEIAQNIETYVIGYGEVKRVYEMCA